MMGIDTNVLVRYFANDEPRQSARATQLIEKTLRPAEPGFVSLVVLVELCWTLRRLYGATPTELLSLVERLTNDARFHIEKRDVVQAALAHCKSSAAKANLPDVLIAQRALAEGCTHTVSFDKAAVRSAGMVEL